MNWEELICVMKKESANLWEQLMTFTWEKLRNWLRRIVRSLKGKLISSLAFHKTICITLFMFFNIGMFIQGEFLVSWWQRWKLQGLKFASYCHTIRMKVRHFSYHCNNQWNMGSSLWPRNKMSGSGTSSQSSPRRKQK